MKTLIPRGTQIEFNNRRDEKLNVTKSRQNYEKKAKMIKNRNVGGNKV